MTAMNQTIRSEALSVWTIVWPLIITNILNVVVGIVDLKMVGALGVESIAAVGIARQVMMFLMVLMIAISGGASVVIANSFGAKNAEQVSSASAKAIVYMVASGLFVVTPAGILTSRGLLTLLGGSAEVVDQGGRYLEILFLGSIFTMLNFAVSGVLLGIGKTKISLVLLVGVNLLNIALNYLLIYGIGPLPALGVAGAALGTVIARAIGAVAGLWVVTTQRLPIRAHFRTGFSIDMPFIRQILRLGGPRSLQGVVRNFSRLLTIRIVTLLPEATRAISAYSIGMQVRMVSSFVGLAFMSAAMARVGQNKGAGDLDLAQRSGWIAAVMATCLMTLVAVTFVIAPSAIMSFFTGDEQVISMGRTFFVVVAMSEPLMAFAFALSGALRGGGDANSPFMWATIADLVVVIAAGYLMAVTFSMGFAGIAVALAVSALVRAIPIMIVYRRGKWRQRVV